MPKSVHKDFLRSATLPILEKMVREGCRHGDRSGKKPEIAISAAAHPPRTLRELFAAGANPKKSFA